MFDLLIQGGTVIDGTRNFSRRADVAIRGDRIVEVGPLDGVQTRRTIDARNLIVAPGFIDVHNHSDGWLLREPHMVAKITQGFTTEIIASDGLAYAPLEPETVADWIHYLRALNGLRHEDYRGWRTLGEYLALLDRRNVENVASLVGYANLRVLACGWGRAPADDVQIKLMRRALRQAMDEGGVGLSTGLDYIAQCFAGTDEIVRVCEALRPYGAPYVTHVRYKEGVVRGVEEAVEIGRRAGVPVHISHLKGATPAETDALLDYVDRIARHEVDFTFDVYPYMPGSTLLASLLPYEVWVDGPLAAAAKLGDPLVRRRFAALLDDYALSLERIRIAWLGGQEQEHWRGATLAEYVAARDQPAADALIDLLWANNLAVLGVFDLSDDERIEPFLKHPLHMVGSDGIYFPGARVHPRVYGTATRILGPLVRDRRLFTLEEAVYKLSGFPARRFGLKDRGVIQEGSLADVVIFDPETVTDRATYDDPHQTSEGMQSVIVNGEIILEDGVPAEHAEPPLPGRALRFGQ